jgi:hypothetical protein
MEFHCVSSQGGALADGAEQAQPFIVTVSLGPNLSDRSIALSYFECDF